MTAGNEVAPYKGPFTAFWNNPDAPEACITWAESKDELISVMARNGGTRIEGFTYIAASYHCSCGEIRNFKTLDDLPDRSLRCACGVYLIKYERAVPA